MHADRAREDRELASLESLWHDDSWLPHPTGLPCARSSCRDARLPALQLALAYLVAVLALVTAVAGVPLAVLLWWWAL